MMCIFYKWTRIQSVPVSYFLWLLVIKKCENHIFLCLCLYFPSLSKFMINSWTCVCGVTFLVSSGVLSSQPDDLLIFCWKKLTVDHLTMSSWHWQWTPNFFFARDQHWGGRRGDCCIFSFLQISNLPSQKRGFLIFANLTQLPILTVPLQAGTGTGLNLNGLTAQLGLSKVFSFF